MEMESSTLFTLGSLASIRTGMVCAVYSNRVREEWISDAERSKADEKAEHVALEAVRVLAHMDAWKAVHQKRHFIPQAPA
jgi:uridine phosphorylase